jgi:hypothetical protein
MRREAPIVREVLWEKIKYKPHSPAQQEFHDSEGRFRIPICGRRFGKSTMAAVDMVEACFIPDAYYWICGPTYKLAEKEFRIVYKAFCDFDKLNMAKRIKKSYNPKQGDMRMEFPWGTILECVSATNQDSLLGEGLSGVIMSEAARHSMETWEAYIEPALSDKLGWASFPTTPRGFNWIQGLWQLGQHPHEPEYDSWRYPSWLNTVAYKINTEPDEEGIANLELQRIKRRASEAWWKQEYSALFTTFQGQIYDEFTEETHIKDITYNPLWRNFQVFDYGFNDPFVCLDIMVDPSDNVYVWREYQMRGKTTWEHGHYLKNRENPDGYHVDCRFGDPRGADEAATLALIIGPVFSQEIGWLNGIETVKRWMKIQGDGRPKVFFDRSCYELNRQIQGLRFIEAKGDKNAKEGQVDYDDHGPDALRYFFSQFFFLGAGTSLAEAYDTSQLGTEAETFFHTRRKITLGQNVGY